MVLLNNMVDFLFVCWRFWQFLKCDVFYETRLCWHDMKALFRFSRVGMQHLALRHSHERRRVERHDCFTKILSCWRQNLTNWRKITTATYEYQYEHKVDTISSVQAGEQMNQHQGKFVRTIVARNGWWCVMVDTEEITMIQGLVQAIKDQFKNKLIIEDRKPIYQYQYNDDTTFVVLAPKYEFYHQLILVRYCLYL